jgi:hypothetical protein
MPRPGRHAAAADAPALEGAVASARASAEAMITTSACCSPATPVADVDADGVTVGRARLDTPAHVEIEVQIGEGEPAVH